MPFITCGSITRYSLNSDKVHILQFCQFISQNETTFSENLISFVFLN